MTPSALVVQVPAHQHDIYYLYLYIYHISTRLHPEHAAAAAEGGGAGEPRGGPAPAPATRVQTRGARGSGGACPARPPAAPPPAAGRPEQLCGGAAVPDQAVAQAAHPQPQLSGESHDIMTCLGSSYASIKLPQTPVPGSNLSLFAHRKIMSDMF